MPTIDIEVVVRAPIERVFDLCRSVEVHVESTGRTRERAVAGVTSGLLGLDDQVTWEATHFGVRQRLSSRIVAFDRPIHFRDSMVTGAFRRFDHDHHFSAVPEGTIIRDRFDFDSPLGPLGHCANALVLTRYMRKLLETRLNVIKNVAESASWPKYLGLAEGAHRTSSRPWLER